MSDELVARLRTEKPSVKLMKEAASVIEELMADCEESMELISRQGVLLRQTANVLKGEPPPASLHDVSDLPVLAAQMMNERRRLR